MLRNRKSFVMMWRTATN